MKKILIVICFVLFLSACTGEKTDDKNLKIYTTVYPLQYIVEELAGDTVEVESILPPGVDAHSYEPTSQEMIKYADSDALIYVGGGMEAFSDNIADALAGSESKLIKIGDHHELFSGQQEKYEGYESRSDQTVIEGVSDHYHTGDALELKAKSKEADKLVWSITNEAGQFETFSEGESFKYEAPDNSFSVRLQGYKNEQLIFTDYADVIIDNHDNFDPHIWIDPLKMIEVADILKDELISLNKEETDLYEANYQKLSKELKALDESYTETLADKTDAKIIVPHKAFGYWQRYGVEQIPVSGFSMADEPSQQQLLELTQKAQEHQLDYVLFEQNSNGKLSRVVQEELGAKTETIHNMEVLTKENIENEENYISLMQKNLKVLDKVTK